jgi:hypothetical protein
MTIDILKKIKLSGDLQPLIEANIVPSRIEMWMTLYDNYLIEYNSTGSKMQAMENVSITYDVSVELIQKVRKKFEISTK